VGCYLAVKEAEAIALCDSYGNRLFSSRIKHVSAMSESYSYQYMNLNGGGYNINSDPYKQY